MKKYAVISLDNWGYNKLISKELETIGMEVITIDFNKLKYTYPNYFLKTINFILKTLFNYNLKREILNRKILKILSKYNRLDKVLIIKGDNLSIKTIKKIKKNHTDELIGFFNDSFDRYPRMKKILPYLDKSYSFEKKDVQKYRLNFITNYIYFDYHSEYSEILKYNIFNIGSINKRSAMLPKLIHYLNSNKIEHHIIAYAKEGFVLENIKIIHKTYSRKKTFEYLKHSKIFLDLQRPNQLGLSFRVFEALGMKKKLITTNSDIVNYDFYHPNNILVIDIENINIPKDFLNSPYQPIEEKIVDKYSLKSFTEKIFNL